MAAAREFDTKYPVSASVQVVRGEGGKLEFVVASRSVWSLPVEAGGRPRRLLTGGRPFASTPCEVDDNARRGVVVGCDDGALYSTLRPDNKLVQTKLDVYSSPVAFAPAKEGSRAIAFGSDDGGIWCVNPAGESLPGFPVKCGAFVSATPAVCDLNGDGVPEIVVGDWAGKLHALRLDGSELPGFPVDLGWPIWSSACVADIDGDGALEILVATRYLHAVKATGETVPGYPRLLGSYAVGSPIVVDLLGDGRAAAVVGSDKLYAFDGAGNGAAGFPRDVGEYLWASPVAVEAQGEQPLRIFVGAWDGRFYEFAEGAEPRAVVETRGPIFATAAVAPAAGGGAVIAVGSWDGRLRVLERPHLRVSERSWPVFHRTAENVRAVERRFERPAAAPARADAAPEGAAPSFGLTRLRPPKARHRTSTFVMFDAQGGERLARAQLIYRVAGEDRTHPSPVVLAGGRLTSLIQPLGVGRVVRFHLEGETFGGARVRHPAEGEGTFVVKTVAGLPLGGLIAKLEGKR